jgi:hypothetical protein
MRPVNLFSALALTALVTITSCSGSGQYTYSEDFNSDVLYSGSWRLSVEGEPPVGATAFWRQGEGIDGSGCIFISSPERAEVSVCHDIEGLDPEKIYRVTASLKTLGVNEGRGAVITVETDDTEQEWNASEFCYGDNDWKEVYVDFVPSHEGKAQIRCRLGDHGGTYNGGTALGNVWWDNVSVREVRPEELCIRSGKHIRLALDAEKVNVCDSTLDRWLADLDSVYESYSRLVGGTPFRGERITVLNSPGIEAGYWALAGNPILWNSHVKIEKSLQNTQDNDDWNFGIMHEIGHTFSGYAREDGTRTNSAWNWNDEIFANFRMSYALEDLCGRMSQRDVIYTGTENMDYYKLAYDETLGAGIAKNNGDALHYTFLRIARKYGWKIYEQAFRMLYALDESETAELKTTFDKFSFFLSSLSKIAGEDVSRTCYTPEEMKLIEESLR